MTDPKTITLGIVLKLAFDEFIKSSAGEAGKKLTGQALEKATEIRNTLYTYFAEKNNQRAIAMISAMEAEGSETEISKNAVIELEQHVSAAIENDKRFEQRMKIFVQEIEALQPTKLENTSCTF
jgi:hypothetical protein